MAHPSWLTATSFALLFASAALAETPPSPQEQAVLTQLRDAAKRQNVTLTPEMEAQALQRLRTLQANALALQVSAEAIQAPAPQASSSSRTPVPAINPAASDAPRTEAASEDWLAEIARHKSHAQATSFEDSQDGFVADGNRWLDPEGSIQWQGVNRSTGDVTYMVSHGPAEFTVKFANVHSPDAPVTVGRLTATGDHWSFVGVDGTQLSGEQVIPLADGLLATRGSVYFRYQFGSRPTSHALPPEYGVLYAQRGDVAGTGFILAVKKSRQTFGDQLNTAAFGSAPRKTPTIFGKRDPDFALIDTASDKLVVLPRSEATTDIPWKYRFNEDGSKNDLSFFNAIDWQQTSIGPIAIVFSDDSSSLFAINLSTGEQATLFKRGLGINDWRATPTADDGLRVDVQLGFKKEVLADVRTSFSK